MSDYGAAYKYDDAIYTTEPVKHDEKFEASMASMNEILKKARAEGLSYGQYIAKHKLALEEAKAAAVKDKPKEMLPKERKKLPAKRCTYGVFKDGELVKECCGGEELAEFIGVDSHNVYKFVRAGCRGDYDIIKLKNRPRIGAVLQLNDDGQAVVRWESASAAAEHFGVCAKYIQWAAYNRKKLRGWAWAYE